MTDRRSLSGLETNLRRAISAADTTLPILANPGFDISARKLVGDEFVRCTAIGVDAYGQTALTGCTRGVNQEDGGSAPREWPGGTYVSEDSYTATEQMAALPDITPADLGRNVVVTSTDGSPQITYSGVISPDGTAQWVPELPKTGVHFGYQGIFGGQTYPFGSPYGVAVAPTGIYVADFTGRLYRFTLTGVYITSKGVAEGFNGNAQQVTYDHVGARIGVTSRTLGILGWAAWSTDLSTRLFEVGGTGTGVGQFTTQVSGVCTTSDGRWHAVDAGGRRIHNYAADGTYIDTWTFASGTGLGQFLTLMGSICVDASGVIHIIDYGNHRIQRFTYSGSTVTAIGSYGSSVGGVGQLTTPLGIAAHDALDYVLVTDTAGTVKVYSSFGRLLEVFPNASNLPVTSNSARGIDWYSDVIAFADPALSVVQRWQSDAGYVNPGITPVVTERFGTGASIAPAATGTDLASCSAGEIAIGGGWDWTGTRIEMYQSTRAGTTGWRVRGRSTEASGSFTLTAHAICLVVPMS